MAQVLAGRVTGLDSALRWGALPQGHHPTQSTTTFLPSRTPPHLNLWPPWWRPWLLAMTRASHPLLRASPDTTATTHSVLTASFSRLPSSPSLLSPPLRWRTIDLRNEVGLLSRIYTGFSLCVSDRFPPVRHSLSLRIFMLVRTRQRTQEQGEDALETALPLASSPSPVGRGFLGLMLVGFVCFFPPLTCNRYRRQPHRRRAFGCRPGMGYF